jgi:hypothetical protein
VQQFSLWFLIPTTARPDGLNVWRAIACRV